MGFYGKIANSNKTAFSFDRTYSSRWEMDLACANDEVFIGRYVLVEYDEPPITAYYNGTDFYSSPAFYTQSKITPREGVIYQDLTHYGGSYTFYKWVAAENRYEALSTNVNSGYAAHYNVDVLAYGRGYDSTAWMKTFDVENNTYRYVLISELNTIVPTFHLITDAPSDAPTAPFFDLDTTSVDYYLHAQAEWGHSVRLSNQPYLFDGNENSQNPTAAKDVIQLSDEQIKYSTVSWAGDPNGNQVASRTNNAVGDGDIYYNKAGFEPENRTFAVAGENNADNDGTVYIKNLTNTINYDMNYSGRRYYKATAGRRLAESLGAGEWNSGVISPDKMEWYIHLPIIGNTICQVWDRMYGYNSQGVRYTHLAQGRSDPDYKVTYDTDYALGCINRVRDILGWILYPKSDLQISPAGDGKIYTSEAAVANKLYYTLKDARLEQGGSITKEEQVIDKYYYFAYDPIYIAATLDTESDDPEDVWYYIGGSNERVTGGENDIFYLDDDGIYKHPRDAIYQMAKSDGSSVDAKYNTFYLAQTRWSLAELEVPQDDTIYGLILELHRLLGDYSPDIRDKNSILGCINLVEDMVTNISKLVKPHRITFTNRDGQIGTEVTTERANGEVITSEIEFPYFASADKQELLDCYGTWRLPVTYKLEAYSSMNNSNSNTWFDGGYYGNSLLHEIYATDTIGVAMRKIQNDIADSYYEPQQILSFTVQATVEGEASSDNLYIENGSSFTAAQLNYTLNKGPRQSISLRRTTPAGAAAIHSRNNIEPDYFVDERANYLVSAIGQYNDTETIAWAAANANTDIVWTLSVTDERSQTATATTAIHYADKIYWFTGAYTDSASIFNTLANLNSFAGNSLRSQLTRKKVSPTNHILVNTDKYFYYMFPSSLGDSEDFFEINGFRGGMDYIGHVDFTNGNNYTTSYKVWRSTNSNLGIITFKALREGEDV